MAHHHHIRLLTPPSRKAGAGARAGVLLWSAAFPVALHALALDPAEHALYAGGGDGRIFELALAGQPGSDRAGSGLGAGSGAGIANGHAGRSSAPDRDVGLGGAGGARALRHLPAHDDRRRLPAVGRAPAQLTSPCVHDSRVLCWVGPKSGVAG